VFRYSTPPSRGGRGGPMPRTEGCVTVLMTTFAQRDTQTTHGGMESRSLCPRFFADSACRGGEWVNRVARTIRTLSCVARRTREIKIPRAVTRLVPSFKSQSRGKMAGPFLGHHALLAQCNAKGARPSLRGCSESPLVSPPRDSEAARTPCVQIFHSVTFP